MNYELFVMYNKNAINQKSFFIVFGNNHYYSVYLQFGEDRIFGLMSGAKLYNITPEKEKEIYRQFKYIIPIESSTSNISSIFNYDYSITINYNDSTHLSDIINSLNESNIDFKYKIHPLNKAHFHIFNYDKDTLISIFILLGANIARA